MRTNDGATHLKARCASQIAVRQASRQAGRQAATLFGHSFVAATQSTVEHIFYVVLTKKKNLPLLLVILMERKSFIVPNSVHLCVSTYDLLLYSYFRFICMYVCTIFHFVQQSRFKKSRKICCDFSQIWYSTV